MLKDRYNREITYLRISVTDRCNLNCRYCVGDHVPFFPHEDIVSYEEIVRFVDICAQAGIKKVKITGGEPLARRSLPSLIRELVNIKGIEDVGLTTNGVFLEKYLAALKEAGLKRVNVSLDTLKRDRFQYITGADALDTVQRGIQKAREAGLRPIKINTVIMKGINDDEILSFVELAKTFDFQVRFIELMSFGAVETSQKFITVPSAEIEAAIRKSHRLTPAAGRGRGPARMFDIEGGSGEIGFISSVTTHMCPECNRIRLTSDGKLRLCLFSDQEYDLRSLLRDGKTTDGEIKAFLQHLVKEKPEKKLEADRKRSCPRTLRNIGG